MLTQRTLAEMVKQALKDQHPEQYRQLEASGELDHFSRLRAEQAMEVRDDLMEKARDEAATSNVEPLQRVRQHMMKNRLADQTAIQQATEFPETSDL